METRDSASPDPLVPLDATIRLAKAADADHIVDIETQSFAHGGERFDARKVRRLLTEPRYVAFVAEMDGRAIAWCVGLNWNRGQVPWGRVYGLAVHPDFRRYRLGGRLLNHLIGVLRERDARRIFLEVRSDNAGAIALYARFGFVPCDDLHHYYGHGVHGRRMVLVAEDRAGNNRSDESDPTKTDKPV